MFTYRSASRTLLAGALLAALSCAACAAAPGGPAVAALGGTTTTTKPSTAPKDGFAQALAFSACMRQHGLPDFPDPTRTGGGIQLKIGSKDGTGINPDSSQFQAAQRACQSLQPGGGPDGAKVDPTKIEPWVACLRAHGLPKFPDPTTANGHLNLNLSGTGLDPGSTQFQNAMTACKSQSPGGGIGIQDGSPPSGGGS